MITNRPKWLVSFSCILYQTDSYFIISEDFTDQVIIFEMLQAMMIWNVILFYTIRVIQNRNLVLLFAWEREKLGLYGITYLAEIVNELVEKESKGW